MEAIKKQLDLSEEAVSIINANSTRKSQGEFVSKVLVDWNALTTGQMTVEECGVFEQINRRLELLEQRTLMILKLLQK